MAIDLSERGFEDLIVNWLTEQNGYELGTNADFNKDYALDEVRLFRYLQDTQPNFIKSTQLETSLEKKNFLEWLDAKLATKGIIEIFQNGLNYKHERFYLYQYRPSEGNETAAKLYAKNIFSVTRQLHYSTENKNSLDLVIFLNGLPLITMELKNNFTHQTTADAVKQYKRRDNYEKIFSFKRCLVHFALDDETVEMCTKLAGIDSHFMPFNKGYNGGAGNPPNGGIKTNYMWKEILTKDELSNILEKYVKVICGKNSEVQIFPRYHQLNVVKKLLAESAREGVGHRYLIQHSAGSGKSNSIAWLASQLVNLRGNGKKIFDTVIVVTDRTNLDKQIESTIGNFMQVKSIVGHAESSSDLKNLLAKGKKIVITTIQKFPHALKKINESFRNKNFAIIIDEAHSSQNGQMNLDLNQVLSGIKVEADADIEDQINALIESKKLAENASYFAFTATPKNKTLEVFGKVMTDANGKAILNADGTRRYEPHDVYSMKQAIEENFIVDVLKNYTPYQSYYHIVKTAVEEKYFEKKNANNILRRYADKEPLAIKEKSAIIVEHFYNVVRRKIKGKARAMVVTSGIKNAIDYYFAITDELNKRQSQFKVVIAFSGEYEYNGEIYTESKLNNFPSSKIEENFRKEPYRILIVADKFQTGYDEPLLQTMYVDKKLSDIKAVQTLSRLNRCAKNKFNTCILDFVNEPYEIKKAFERYYKSTILLGGTNINQLNELINNLQSMEIYSSEDVEKVVKLFLYDGDRIELEAIIDKCAAKYNLLNVEDKLKFKSGVKNFMRNYNFLSAIMPSSSSTWEKLSIFFRCLDVKLLLPINYKDESIVENVDLENYRAVAKETLAIVLENEDAFVKSNLISVNASITLAEWDTLTHILAEFHKLFGDTEWSSHEVADPQLKQIFFIVKKDFKVQNAIMNSDEQNLHIEIDRAVSDAMDTITSKEFYIAYSIGRRNKLGQSLNTWLNEIMFQAIYS